MKQIKNHFTSNVPGNCFQRIAKFRSFVWLFILFIFLSSCNVYLQSSGGTTGSQPPPWAPGYENVSMVRYYYFPDIECYYDVWNREFAYLEDGSWMFGATLPPSYSWFDLNTAFVVLLDYNVFEPWRYFDYYVSHYPRYYYRSIYKDRYEDVRNPPGGFNENSRTVVNRNPEESIERNREELKRNETVNQEKDRERVEREVNTRQEFPERKVEPTRPAQRMEYTGKDIGHPVRVQQHMTEPRESRRK
jgi:hypothetical protein